VEGFAPKAVLRLRRRQISDAVGCGRHRPRSGVRAAFSTRARNDGRAGGSARGKNVPPCPSPSPRRRYRRGQGVCVGVLESPASRPHVRTLHGPIARMSSTYKGLSQAGPARAAATLFASSASSNACAASSVSTSKTSSDTSTVPAECAHRHCSSPHRPCRPRSLCPDDGYDIAPLSLLIALRPFSGGRNQGRGMGSTKSVILALGPLAET
jgi:hypothetical protein